MFGLVATLSRTETVPIITSPRGALAINEVREHELAVLVAELQPSVVHIVVTTRPDAVLVIVKRGGVQGFVQV